MLYTAANKIFAVIALLSVAAAWLLIGAILLAAIRRLARGGGHWPAYRLELQGRSVHALAAAVALAELGGWLIAWSAASGPGPDFPLVVALHLLLIAFLADSMESLLGAFSRSVGGDRRFPGSGRRGLWGRMVLAVSLSAWCSLGLLLLHRHVPGMAAPNVPVLLPLLVALCASALAVFNDAWIGARLGKRHARG